MFESRSSSGSGLWPVAVHVDGLEDALGQVLLDSSRQLGDQERKEDGSEILNPSRLFVTSPVPRSNQNKLYFPCRTPCLLMIA